MQQDDFKNYHYQLLDWINETINSIEVTKIDPHKVRWLISILSFKLDYYFENIYPEILNSPDIKIQIKALKHKEVVKNISKQYKEYESKWQNYLHIKNNTKDFCHETRNILAIIKLWASLEFEEFYLHLTNPLPPE
ncbi:MAG TPA: hypothetical protein VEC37_05110 [Bacillota bacterium]|nr:hypothetical protein [Bacillota bacterium]